MGLPWIARIENTRYFLNTTAINSPSFLYEYPSGEMTVQIVSNNITVFRIHDVMYFDYTTKIVFSILHTLLFILSMVLLFLSPSEEASGEGRMKV